MGYRSNERHRVYFEWVVDFAVDAAVVEEAVGTLYVVLHGM